MSSYRSQIEVKYILVEAILDANTIKQGVKILKNNQKFNDLKKYYDTVRKDLIKSSSLSQEEASSVINYAIHSN